MLMRAHLIIKKYFLFVEKRHSLIYEFYFGCIVYSFGPLLILFLTQELSFSQSKSYSIMACFLGSGYILLSMATSLINKCITYSFAIFQRVGA